MSTSTVILVFTWMKKEPPDTSVDFIKITGIFEAIPVKNISPATCKKKKKGKKMFKLTRANVD